MNDAGRIDLNYGHFGQPVYDAEAHKWHWPRETQRSTTSPTTAPWLQQLSEPRLLIPPSLSNPPRGTGTAAKRRKNAIDQLLQECPEITPAAALLPTWAEESEVIQDGAAKYDPAISDILAFGRAYHPLHHRESPPIVPVVALPGGAAGEFIRVIQLIPEVVGWDGGSGVQLHDDVFQSRVQGLWCGNGSRIQQLQFAQSNDEPTEWLAVRYGGITSILRVILRATEVPTHHSTSRLPAIEENAEFCIELKQIITLSMQRSGGVPHAAVCFNPWNPRQFAVVDQSSHWTVWTIRSINKKTNVWTLDPGASGYLVGDLTDDEEESAPSESKFDGWGAANWAGNGTCLLVCNRRRMVCFQLQDPPRPCLIPDLGLEKTTDWILDVKKAPTNPSHLFIATSSRVFWLRLTSEHAGEAGQPQLNMKVLLSWTHFRNGLDVSLSMHIFDLDSTLTKVLLYSRLTGLKTVFTFNILRSALTLPLSTCDPYKFPDTDNNPASPKVWTLALMILPHKHHQGRDRDGARCWYAKCVTVSADLSLHEGYLLATSSGVRHPTGAPQTRSRPQPTRKSSYRSDDDFIVPNGVLGIQAQVVRSDRGQSRSINAEAVRLGDSSSELSRNRLRKPLVTPSQDQWTINVEWLIDQLSSTVTKPFHETLRLIWSDIFETDMPGVVTLSEFVDQDIGAGDIEEDSEALEDLLRQLDTQRTGGRSESEDLPEGGITISQLASPSLPSCLQAGPSGLLTQTYDGLVTSWITSLATKVPGRVRTRYERMIRGVAAELQLASIGVRLQTVGDQVENHTQGIAIAGQAPFTIPDRSIPVFSQESRRVQAKATEQASAQVVSSQMMAGHDSPLPATGLPTPEPTPSLRSQGSGGSQSTQNVVEDPIVQRLRQHVSVESRPLLSALMTRNLSHWPKGGNPDDYDWERMKDHLERADEPEVAEESARAKKKRRKERSVERRWMENTAASSSRIIPIRQTASQTEMPSGPDYSSQPTLVTASQPLPGPHGGAIKAKKGRKKGF